jgi:mono/diheme cytochrome c family protein
MKRSLSLIAAFALFVGPVRAATAADVRSDLLQRGEYLTRAADCVSCHTAPDGEQFAGARAFKLPFGTLYSPNITPDASTGIGQWSDDDFVRAMHEGIGKDGQRLYPAFPYPSYTLLSRDDVLAIKAYLFSLKPVANAPPHNHLTFPFNMRWLMVFWDWLYNPNRRFEADASRPPEWNRGAYLVEALGHCGECHTPRNLLYGLDPHKKFAGAVTAGWHAYNITPDRKTGIGDWSGDDLARYLSTGDSPQHGAAAGPMGEAVDNSLRYLTRDDVEAIVTYLRTVPATASDIPAGAPTVITDNAPANTSQLPSPDELNRIRNDVGVRIFAGACAGCHGWDGRGMKGSRDVNDPEALNLTQVILDGVHVSTSGNRVDMPGFRADYADAEVAALANYLTGQFGSKPATLKPDDVAKRRNGD